MFVLEYYSSAILFAMVHEAFRFVNSNKDVPDKTIFRLAKKFRDRGSVCDKPVTVLTQDMVCVAEERLIRSQRKFF
jgi:hypothetical protein